MRNAVRKWSRWIFVSAPGVGVLVISAGLGIGYAATKGDSGDVTRAEKPNRDEVGFVAPFGGKDLSDADRKALDAFHACMRETIEPAPLPAPGEDATLPDPERMQQKFEAAFDRCKGELTAELRAEFEKRHQQMDAVKDCLEENGVEAPPGGPPARPPAGGPPGPPPPGAGRAIPVAPPAGAIERYKD